MSPLSEPEGKGRPEASGIAQPASTDSGLLEMLTLERVEDNYFRTGVFSSEPGGLYEGQVAAQALRAGAETVPPGRHTRTRATGTFSAAATRLARYSW